VHLSLTRNRTTERLVAESPGPGSGVGLRGRKEGTMIVASGGIGIVGIIVVVLIVLAIVYFVRRS
jgi:hypothetical protein